MIISDNQVPSLEQFDDLCNKTRDRLNTHAKNEPSYFLSKDGTKLELEVKKAMDEVSIGTPFEGRIEIISGQKFPDIVAAKYYGLEVKSSKNDQWTTLGGSVAEGTRVADVTHINLIFGKLSLPIEFKVRRYQDCLSDIAVTHSPRYKIDMNIEEKDTIFSKMGMEYEYIQKSSDPLKPVVSYFRSILKEGESLWWVNGDNPADEAVPVKIRLWSTLSASEKHDLVCQGLAFFPEIFGSSGNKYERFSLWLMAKHGVLSTSMRDSFTAGGRKDISVNGNSYNKVPRIYDHLRSYSSSVSYNIGTADGDLLKETWQVNSIEQNKRILMWSELVSRHSGGEYDMLIMDILKEAGNYPHCKDTPSLSLK